MAELSFFSRIKDGLQKTRQNILGNVGNVLAVFTKIDEELFEELEEALILADLGVQTAEECMAALRDSVKKGRVTDVDGVKDELTKVLSQILTEGTDSFVITPPCVFLIIGVNGTGKTTSIGKLCRYYTDAGKKVMVAAADTFRAAAIDQLNVWAKRTGVPIISHAEGADPAAVVYDAVAAAKARGVDILICDTAGRLHNKKNLMDELSKIRRVIQREYPAAQIETLLVLDAATGQNAVLQARQFNEAAQLSGLILTKLDSTAKGGVVITVKNELNIPVRFIGVGESEHDLREFNAGEFARALFEE